MGSTILPYSEGRSAALHDNRNELIRIQYCNGATANLKVVSFLLHLLIVIPLYFFIRYQFDAIRASMKTSGINAYSFLINTLATALLICSITCSWVTYCYNPGWSLNYSFALISFILMVHSFLYDILVSKERGTGNINGCHSYIRLLRNFSVFYFIFFIFWTFLLKWSDFTVGSTNFDFSNMAKLNVAALFWFFSGVIFCLSTWHRKRYISIFAFFIGIIPFAASIIFNYVAEIYPKNILYFFHSNSTHYALHIEILSSRLCFSIPLLGLLIWKAIDRFHYSKRLTSFLKSSKNESIEFWIPLFGQIKLRSNGILEYPLFRSEAKKKATPDPTLTLTTFINFSTFLSFFNMIKSIIQCSRPLNVALAMLTTLYSFILCANRHTPSEVIVVMISIGLMVGSQMIFNDCTDIKIDKINKPSRPIASSKLKLNQGYTASLFMMSTSILLSSFISQYFFYYLSIVCLFCIFYSLYLKYKYAFLANLLSSTLTTSICFIGLFFGKFYIELLWIALSVFFSCLAREIIKDIEDKGADKLFRKGALHNWKGDYFSLLIAKICIVLQCFFSYFPYFFGDFDIDYLILITTVNLIMVLKTVLIPFSSQIGTISTIHKRIKLSMVFYVLSFLLVTIF